MKCSKAFCQVIVASCGMVVLLAFSSCARPVAKPTPVPRCEIDTAMLVDCELPVGLGADSLSFGEMTETLLQARQSLQQCNARLQTARAMVADCDRLLNAYKSK